MPVSLPLFETRPLWPPVSKSTVLLRPPTFLITFPHVPLTGEGLQASSREHCCALRIRHMQIRYATDILSKVGLENLHGTGENLEQCESFRNSMRQKWNVGGRGRRPNRRPHMYVYVWARLEGQC